MKSKLLLLFCAFSLQQGVNAQATKKVLFEEINGAWCGRVPFGDWIIDNNLVVNYPNVLPVILHYGTTTSNNQSRYDLLSNTYSDSIIDVFYVGVPHPAPEGMVDRFKFSTQTNVVVPRPNDYTLVNNAWRDNVVTRLATSSPVSVTISGDYNNVTRVLNATVNTNFVASASGDMRINLWIVEDSVVGSGYGYDQHTYDYNNAASPFYQVGVQGVGEDTIPGYVHRHVLRGGASPAFGSAGIIPASVTNGQNFSANYTYILPANWNENNINLVAFVSVYSATINNHEVLNAEQVSLMNITTGINDVTENNANAVIYPNPSTGITTMNFSLNNPSHTAIAIFNLLGEKILTIEEGALSSGRHTAYFDAGKLESGMYFIHIKTESGTSSEKLMVTK